MCSDNGGPLPRCVHYGPRCPELVKKMKFCDMTKLACGAFAFCCYFPSCVKEGEEFLKRQEEAASKADSTPAEPEPEQAEDKPAASLKRDSTMAVTAKVCCSLANSSWLMPVVSCQCTHIDFSIVLEVSATWEGG